MNQSSASPSPAPARSATQSDLVRAALVVVATLVGLQLLWSARLLVLTIFLGLLFGLAASGAVDWITARIRVRRGIAAPVVVFGTVALLVVVTMLTGPTLVGQSRELRTKLPEAVTKLETWLAAKQPGLFDIIAPPDSNAVDTDSVAKAAASAPDDAPALAASGAPADAPASAVALAAQGRLAGALSRHSTTIANLAFGVLQSTLAVVAAILLVVFLAVYVAIDPGVYRRGALLLVPLHRRDRVGELLTALGTALRTWFATQLIAMLVIGIVTTVALTLVGVRAALPLGVLAGIFEFVPNIGPLLSAIPAVLMGFADSPRMALIVLFLYWAIQFAENHLLIPFLMQRQLAIPPALTLISQVVMAYVFGFLGLFVAIPLLATVVVAVQMLWVDEEPAPLPAVDFPMPPIPLSPGPPHAEAPR